MKVMRRVLTVVAVVLLAGTAHAQSVNWKWVEAGWAKFDPSHSTSRNGWFAAGAFDLKNIPIHLFAEYADFDRYDLWQVGGGWHGLLGERADLFADGAFYDLDQEDGFRVRFGVRWMLTKRLELNGYLAWTDLDFTDNSSFAANAVWDFTKRLALGGGFQWGDEFDTSQVFVRFNFGPRS